MSVSGSKKREHDRDSVTLPAPVTGRNEGGYSAQSGNLLNKLNPAEMLSQYKNASLEFGAKKKEGGGRMESENDKDSSKGAHQLSRELDQYIADGLAATLATTPSVQAVSAPGESISDLQLKSARKLRQLLPTNKDLLHLVQERNWIPLLLGWLNLHDRPAVQVEALLALTNIAELCAQQSYYSSSSSSAAAQAAVKVTGTSMPHGSGVGSASVPPFYSFPSGDAQSTAAASASYPYPTLIPPSPGSVPFPPLSFSQTLSAEALAAFDASLSSTIQQSKEKETAELGAIDTSQAISSSLSTRGNPPFAASLQSGNPPMNYFLPPPTPVLSQGIGSTSFPQQLSASSQHLLLRHADAIPTLISLLSSSNREVYEQSVWILGSIAAGDSSGSTGTNSTSSNSESSRDKAVAARDVILAAGVMKQLLRCLEAHPADLSLQRIGSWTLSNLVEGIFQQSNHGKSGPKSSEYSSSDEIEMHIVLPVLRRLLRMGDAEVLSYTCWTLSHLCDGPSSHIFAVVTTRDLKALRGGLVPRLVELLGHGSWRVTKPALRTIGNIVCAECSDDANLSSSAPTDYTEVILDCNAVPKLKELVTHSNREIQKEACWTLSNIAAGTVDQIQAVIDSGAVPPLVKLVSNKGTDQEVRSEACWVVLNATSCGSDSQIEVLVDEGCVSVLGVLLGEASMVMMALEGLERVLQVEEAREAAMREASQGDEAGRTPILVSAALIEKALDKHNSTAVTKRASRIWKQHFVSCALCHKSFSKHRRDATFCEECKCYVCSHCDCQIYHLSYQEELWAATEEQTEAKKNAKKSKKAKKKEKQKQKKAKQHEQPQVQSVESSPPETVVSFVGQGVHTRRVSTRSPHSNFVYAIGESSEGKIISPSVAPPSSDERTRKVSEGASPISSDIEDQEDEDHDGQNVEQAHPSVDFVLYLQQTGSIIALAKLMDALDYGEGFEVDDFDDVELQMLRQHKELRDVALR